MQTACISSTLDFQPLGRRRIQVDFDAGYITNDAGVLLLRELANAMALFQRAADCFTDHRDPERTEHSVRDLIAQRTLAIAHGYEDLNDHNHLQNDVAFAVAIGKNDPTGEHRRRRDHQGKPLASPATLNRIENAPQALDSKRPDWKILHHTDRWEQLFLDLFLDAHPTPPQEIILDLDATDDLLHGQQEGRFFHGYYDAYCFLPLYIFADDHLLVAKLRPANIDGAAGALEEVQRIVKHLRKRWPDVRFLIRADSGFARDALMTWCEETDGVDYLVGLARNARLQRAIQPLFAALKRRRSDEVEPPSRLYGELDYRTLNSWSAERRVLAKAEILGEKENPRFVVTSLDWTAGDAERLYRDYCQRGEMENRIKEQQLDLFADRTSAHRLRANQLRVWLSSLAYVLLSALRREGLRGTVLSRAQCGTMRLRVLKLGALVQMSVRRIRVSLSRYAPVRELFEQILLNVRSRWLAVCG